MRHEQAHTARLTAILAICLALGTIAVYSRALKCDYVNYDDAEYTQHPLVLQGVTAKGLAWAFTGVHAGNRHPLTTISHMLDAQLFGHGPLGPHAVNVLLHALNTLLLFLILTRMTRSAWRSAFVAAAFAVHPLHVESVAWIAERKDVLSTLFWMLTMGAYLRYVERRTPSDYSLVILLFALGLMAKPMLVSLPFVLILLDYWPLGRLKGRASVPQLVLEKLPLFALAAVSCAITYYVQHRSGAGVTLGQVPLGLRAENAAISYVIYIWKMLLPYGLAVFYPYPTHPPAVWIPLSALLLLVGVSAVVTVTAKRLPYLVVGWLWYVVTLIPVIGLVQVGQQAMADRYTYIPLIGLFVIAAWGIPDLVRRLTLPHPRTPARPHSHTPSLIFVAGGLVIAVLAICTWRQTEYWQNRLTLFSHALAVTSDNYLAHDMVGAALGEQGKDQAAVEHYAQAIEIKPDDDLAYNNLGNSYFRMGRPKDALKAYGRAIRIRPEFPLAHFNFGMVLVALGQAGEAAAQFQAVARINRGPLSHPEMFTQNGPRSEAKVTEAEKLVRARLNDPVATCNLSLALAQVGRLDEAAATLFTVARSGVSSEDLGHRLQPSIPANRNNESARYLKAVQKNPGDARAHFYMGNEYAREGNRPEAIREFREAIRIKPAFAQAHNNLAVHLFFTGDYAEAWHEVYLTRKYGAQVHPRFIQELSKRMPDPGK